MGGKSKDKGRWSVGVKLAWVINSLGDVCAWSWDTLNTHDQAFLPLLELLDEESIVLADYGFRCAAGIPANVKLCKKGTWNERMTIETHFSLLTVICKARRCITASPNIWKPVSPTLPPCSTSASLSAPTPS